MAKAGNIKDKSWGSLGGNNAMHGFEPAGRQKPGGSAVDMEGGSKRGIAPEAGPSGVMGFSKNEAHNSHGAGPQVPGQSSVSGARQEGFAHGGKTSMFGNRGSRPARPGCTGPDGG